MEILELMSPQVVLGKAQKSYTMHYKEKLFINKYQDVNSLEVGSYAYRSRCWYCRYLDCSMPLATQLPQEEERRTWS